MPVLERTQEVPLALAEDGTIRVAGTRVSFESLVHHYEQGATAEEITLRFPALRLADVHSCLAYYLNHQEKIREYVGRQQQRAEQLREQMATDPEQQRGLSEMRERIRNRASTPGPEVS